jgi:hypothetical protein
MVRYLFLSIFFKGIQQFVSTSLLIVNIIVNMIVPHINVKLNILKIFIVRFKYIFTLSHAKIKNRLGEI